MQEVIRMKKVEERNEVDREVDAGFLLLGSPDRKQRKQALESMSERKSSRGSLKLDDVLSSVSKLEPFLMKLKPEDIEHLEQSCQKMIFEKEDKFVDTENKLKEEEDQIAAMEEELQEIETRLKEKN